jgi:hypothetical protein
MITIALVTFGALMVAWVVAPDDPGVQADEATEATLPSQEGSLAEAA